MMGWAARVGAYGGVKRGEKGRWPRLGGTNCAGVNDVGASSKKFHIFNIALLARQGWQILNNLSSLVTQVLGNFLCSESTCSHCPRIYIFQRVFVIY